MYGLNEMIKDEERFGQFQTMGYILGIETQEGCNSRWREAIWREDNSTKDRADVLIFFGAVVSKSLPES